MSAKSFNSGYLKLKEAAEYLRVSKSTLYKRTMRRSIPFYRFGGKILFKPDDLDEFIKRSRMEPDFRQGGVYIEN